MKKLSILFGLLLLVAGNVWSQHETNLPMMCQSDSLTGPRSSGSFFQVTLDDSELIADFSSSTPSLLLIIDQSTNQTVYSDSFASTTQVIIDLEDEGIGEGSYQLRIYAFGKWWWGEFVLEEE